MIFNSSFTTYRRVVASSKYDYSGSATITAGEGFLEKADANLRAVLGLDLATEAWSLISHETDFEKGDRVVISAVNYYVDQIILSPIEPQNLTQLILLLDK